MAAMSALVCGASMSDKPNPERTARFNRWRTYHGFDDQEVADRTGRAKMTAVMWRLGNRAAIPEHTLALLEMRYPIDPEIEAVL